LKRTRQERQHIRSGRFARQQWRAWIETQLRIGSPASNAAKNPGLRRFARQQWRAWIETQAKHRKDVPERFARQQWRAWIETMSALEIKAPYGSPASNGGRGLKRPGGARTPRSQRRFARQQWRAWIETSDPWRVDVVSKGSPPAMAGAGSPP
jgi:hypothetical protein